MIVTDTHTEETEVQDVNTDANVAVDASLFGFEESTESVDENPESDSKGGQEQDADDDAVDEESGAEEPGKTDEGESEGNDKVEITPDLIYEAAQVGMDLEDVKRFSSAEDLLIAMNLLKSKGNGQSESETQEEPEDWFDLGFDPEVVDEDLIEPLQKMNNFYKDQVMAVKEQIGMIREQMLQQQQLEFEQRFEDNVNGLGDEWKDVLGKGSIDEIKETELENRKRLYKAMTRILDVDEAKGVRRPMKKVIEDALLIEFKDKIKESERKRILNSANKRTKTHKPVNKQKAYANDEEEAISFLRDSLREMGAKEEPAFIPFG